MLLARDFGVEDEPSPEEADEKDEIRIARKENRRSIDETRPVWTRRQHSFVTILPEPDPRDYSVQIGQGGLSWGRLSGRGTYTVIQKWWLFRFKLLWITYTYPVYSRFSCLDNSSSSDVADDDGERRDDLITNAKYSRYTIPNKWVVRYIISVTSHD